MEGPHQQECEEAMQGDLGYINTTIRLVSYICYNSHMENNIQNDLYIFSYLYYYFYFCI